jgi:2-(1,2-epoxy-1,2-dihydrophenyl)acetyl-CoA isomerase
MIDELLEKHDAGIATLTLNRPSARNALTDEMLDALLTCLRRLSQDPAVRVLVLTGTGDCFCAGGDVKSVAARARQPDTAGTPERRMQLLRERMEISRVLHEMPKPTVAVIPGAAAGAGFSLALACDLRLMADEAKLLPAFSAIGLSGDFGGSYFLTQLVGAGKARELYFLGTALGGKEAQGLGIVNRSVPRSELAALAHTYALELAQGPAAALGYIKRNLNLAEHATLSEVLDQEAANMVFASLTQDHKAAVAGLLGARRPPDVHPPT